MKILHVITSLQTGGAETLVVNMLPRFVALGHEVGLVIFNGERTALTERLERECPECKLYALGTGYYNPTYILKLIKIMRQYDVVHTHNSSPQLFAAIANIVCHKRLVTTEHSTNNRKREKGGWLRILDKWMYRQYDKIICISEIAEKSLRRHLGTGTGTLTGTPFNSKIATLNDKIKNPASSRITTINNGVDVEAIHNAEPIKEMRSERFVVVMVAGFREAKDQDTLIRAMSLLPKEEYELWLVGDGMRAESLKFKVESLKLGEHVKFLGLRTDVPNILKTADAVVMSSHWEGLSLSNIEGMAAGKPFVASDVDGLREVTDGYGLLFPHEDAQALADIIKRLDEDKEYYDEVADRCYQRAKEYDLSSTIAEYNKVYCI